MTIGSQKSPIIILRTALQHALDELRRINTCAHSVRPDVLYVGDKALAETFLAPIENASPVEQRIVGKLVQDILAGGYTIHVFDGEEFCLENSTDPDAIYAALASTDSDRIYVNQGAGRHLGWVLLVWGNDDCVISDYVVNGTMEALLAGANALADELEG